jgi:hypothetical protein
VQGRAIATRERTDSGRRRDQQHFPIRGGDGRAVTPVGPGKQVALSDHPGLVRVLRKQDHRAGREPGQLTSRSVPPAFGNQAALIIVQNAAVSGDKATLWHGFYSGEGRDAVL